MIVESVTGDEWVKRYAHECYPSTFGSARPLTLERCQYALIVKDGESIIAFATAVEMDSETAYWQFGGAMNAYKKSMKVFSAYGLMVSHERKIHKRLTTRIENTNMPMLKMAMAVGFRVVGTWNFKDTIYLELLNEFGGY